MQTIYKKKLEFWNLDLNKALTRTGKRRCRAAGRLGLLSSYPNIPRSRKFTAGDGGVYKAQFISFVLS